MMMSSAAGGAAGAGAAGGTAGGAGGGAAAGANKTRQHTPASAHKRSSTSGGGGAGSRSILKTKVNNVLSSSSRRRLQSRDVTTALKALSTFYLEQQTEHARLQREQHDRDNGRHGVGDRDLGRDDDVAVTPLGALSAASSLEERRNLRSMLEKRAVRTSQALVKSFKGVNERLEALENNMQTLHGSCEELLARLRRAKKSSSKLLARTQELQEKRQVVASRKKLVVHFLQRFQLTDDEKRALESDSIDDDFFRALDRVTQIRNDCKGLLQTYHQRVGLDILDSLGKHIETAYEKLYLWVQAQGRSLNTASNPEVSPVFVRALALLKQRPVYFNHCCQEIYQARRVVLIRRFITALTRGGPGGVPRPIEIHAHNPVRFVSDMLAWVHQAVASEREFFLTIMSAAIADSEAAPGDTAASDDVDAGVQSVWSPAVSRQQARTSENDIGADAEREQVERDLLGQVMDGLCRPLKMRAEQALASPDSTPVTLYHLAQVLDYFTHIISRLLPDGTTLVDLLGALRGSAQDSFYAAVKANMDRLLASPPPYTHDLSPPRVMSDAMNQLAGIMAVFQQSLLPPEQRHMPFAPVLSVYLEPLHSLISLSGSELDESDAAVYHLNALDLVMGTLEQYRKISQARLETLSLQRDEYVATLVRLQSQKILQKCGLAAQVRVLRQFNGTDSDSDDDVSVSAHANGHANGDDDSDDLVDENEQEQKQKPKPTGSLGREPRVDRSLPLSRQAGMDLTSLQVTVKAFYDLLFSLGSFVMPQIDRILNARVRSSVRDQICRVISVRYKTLYEAVASADSDYPEGAVQMVFSHSPSEIDTVLMGAT